MRKRLIPAVAIVVTAAVAAISIGATTRGSDDETIRFTAHFQDSIGLYEGNAVSVLGMEVGSVTKITPAGDHIDVEMAIDSGVDVPADVQAVTVSTSILTDRHVELTPVYREGPRLRSGDIIGLTRTRTPVQFDKSLAMVDKLMRSLGGDEKGNGPLADLVGAGDAIVTRSGADLKATLTQLAEALKLGADKGVQSGKDIQSIVRNVADLTQVAADNDAKIREFGSTLRQFANLVDSQDLGSGDTGKQLNVVLDRTIRLLQQNREKFDSTVVNANVISKVIADYRDQVAELVDVGPTLADNLYNAVDSNAGVLRMHIGLDKMLINGQPAKEVCNLLQIKQLNCATGTLADYGPDFGLGAMLELMATAPSK